MSDEEASGSDAGENMNVDAAGDEHENDFVEEQQFLKAVNVGGQLVWHNFFFVNVGGRCQRGYAVGKWNH